jgi:tripartite ATP-independent transporter DctP family solute receptor
MKKTFSLVLAAILGMTLVLSGCGKSSGSATPQSSESSNGSVSSQGSGKTYSFKLTHITQPSHVWHKTAEKFAEELKARSNGRMKLDIFPASQLGPESDMVQQMETGTVDFGIIAGGYTSTREGAFSAWFMPFLFKDMKSAVDFRNSDQSKKILGELSKQGLVGMDIIFAGNRHILMKNTNVIKPEDLKGKKIRIAGGPAITDFWSAVGAGPTPLPLPEVYTALQTGVIDGIDIDLDALMTEKYFEIAKNFTLTNHMAWPGIAMMSKVKYDALPLEDQKIVTEAMKAAVEFGNQESISRETKNLTDLKAKGVTVNELSNPDSFNPVRDQIYNKYSSNPLIKDFIQANQKK